MAVVGEVGEAREDGTVGHLTDDIANSRWISLR
jgi:hypothetical protein